MFKVGQKMVCVSQGADWPNFPSVNFPKIGEVYTIRDIGPSYKHGGAALRLLEIRNRKFNIGEPNFYVFRFRPVMERKTDISFAHEILRKASKRVPAMTSAHR